MRTFWARLGILLPIYRPLGNGLTDTDIAGELNLTEDKVEKLRFLDVMFLRSR